MSLRDRIRRLEAERRSSYGPPPLTRRQVIEEIGRLEAGLPPRFERWQAVESLFLAVADLHDIEHHGPVPWRDCPICAELLTPVRGPHL